MAVSKLWPVTVRLATVLDYASNPEKTTKAKSKYSAGTTSVQTSSFFISALGRGANQDLKAGVITQAEQDKADREAVAQEVPTKTKGEIIVEGAMGKPMQKEGQSHENPTVAKTEKSPPSERGSETKGSTTDRGTAKQADSRPEMDRQGYHNRK